MSRSRSGSPVRPLPKLPSSTNHLPESFAADLAITKLTQVQKDATAAFWRTLEKAAMQSQHTLFTVAARQIAPHWTSVEYDMFLNQADDLERWSLLPGAKRRSAAMAANKCPLMLLDDGQCMPQLETALQYSVQSKQDTEHDFQRLKQSFGSRLTFHGSLLRNWHQILSQGLEPKSGTTMQANGAVKGNGLYVGLCSYLSAGFVDRIGTRLMGVVEVINHPMVKVDRDALVVPTKSLFRLRYIAVYTPDAVIPHVDADMLDKFFKPNRKSCI